MKTKKGNTPMTITGTWEEIAALGDKLSGKELTLIVPNVEPESADDLIRLPHPLAEDEWDRLQEQLREGMAQAWPKDLSVVDAMREDRR